MTPTLDRSTEPRRHPAMSQPRSRPRPTEAELVILTVLWERGPSTVREVHEHLPRGRAQVGYTTVLKLLQIMSEKGLVTRDATARSHVYTAHARESVTKRALLRDLADRAFGGSAQRLVLEALSSKKASREELAEIRRLLDELEEDAP